MIVLNSKLPNGRIIVKKCVPSWDAFCFARFTPKPYRFAESAILHDFLAVLQGVLKPRDRLYIITVEKFAKLTGCQRGDRMKRQLQGIAIILVCILLMLGFGNEPVFDLSFRWSVVFAAGGVVGAIMTFLPDKK